MNEKRLRKLAGLDEGLETKKEKLNEGGFDVRPQVGPNYSTTVWKKLIGMGTKGEFEVKFNISSFSLERDIIPRNVPTDFNLMNEWEQKQAKALSKKATPVIKKFISDLNKLLKNVK